MYKFLFEHLLSLLLDMYRYGNSMFNLLRNHQNVFHHFHLQCIRVLIFLYLPQHLLHLDFVFVCVCVYVCVLWPSSGCFVISHCGFDSHFTNN